MKPFELTEIELDKKRLMLLDHPALMVAEREINKFRQLSRFEWMSIDWYVGQARLQFVAFGNIPADICQILLWASFQHEDQLIAIDTVGKLITDRKYVNDKILECLDTCWPGKPASEQVAEDSEKKATGQPNGVSSGHSPESSSE